MLDKTNEILFKAIPAKGSVGKLRNIKTSMNHTIL